MITFIPLHHPWLTKLLAFQSFQGDLFFGKRNAGTIFFYSLYCEILHLKAKRNFTLLVASSSDFVSTIVMYRSNRSFNMPPPGIPRAFNTFDVPGRREFDYQSLPRGGEFDPHALGVENLNCTLHFM